MAAGQEIQFGQQLQLPVVEHFRAHRSQIGGGQDVQHLQDIDRSDFAGQAQNDRFVMHILAKGHVGHGQMLGDQEPQLVGVRFREMQSPRHIDGDQGPDLTVIIVVSFAQIVDQQSQMQQPFVAQVPIGISDGPRVSPGTPSPLPRPGWNVRPPCTCGNR